MYYEQNPEKLTKEENKIEELRIICEKYRELEKEENVDFSDLTKRINEEANTIREKYINN